MSTRTTKVYSITMPPDLGRQAEQLAKDESRTMSELVREAIRRYQIQKAERELLADPARPKHLAALKRVLTELQEEAKRNGLDKMTMREINAEIAATRKAPARKKKSKQPAA